MCNFPRGVTPNNLNNSLYRNIHVIHHNFSASPPPYFLGHNHYHQLSLDPLIDYVICVRSLSTNYTIVLLIAIVYIQTGLFLATASAYLCGCFGFFDLFGKLWATSSSTSSTTSWFLIFCRMAHLAWAKPPLLYLSPGFHHVLNRNPSWVFLSSFLYYAYNIFGKYM